MFKKFWVNIITFFHLFLRGLHIADKIAFGSKEDSLNKSSSLEQQNEQNSVWNDLMKGVVTQEVKDLRYETHHVVRESYNYEYIGNGVAKKKTIFSFKGNVENNENYKIKYVQDNSVIVKGVYDSSEIKEYRIKYKYDFLPKFRVDSYTKKIVVKETEAGDLQIDIYFSEYLEKYNNEHKFFISELNKVYNGDKRSDILDIKELTFTSWKAYGLDDDIIMSFNLTNFIDIVKYDGSFVVKFKGILKESKDLIELVYDEKSAEKFKNKTKRNTKKTTGNYGLIVDSNERMEKEKEYADKYKKLLEELNE